MKISGYASTDQKDRCGDIIPASAWANGLSGYEANPIMLYQHQQRSPIGRVDSLTVDDKGLFIEATISEVAETQFGLKTLIKDNVVKTLSVGFVADDCRYDSPTDTFVITEATLLEISVVSVPANPTCLFSEAQ